MTLLLLSRVTELPSVFICLRLVGQNEPVLNQSLWPSTEVRPNWILPIHTKFHYGNIFTTLSGENQKQSVTTVQAIRVVTDQLPERALEVHKHYHYLSTFIQKK